MSDPSPSKPVVIRSIEDGSGARCVDVIRAADGFGWLECRRDPEDGHGWRPLGPAGSGLEDATAALTDAARCVPWLLQTLEE